MCTTAIINNHYPYEERKGRKGEQRKNARRTRIDIRCTPTHSNPQLSAYAPRSRDVVVRIVGSDADVETSGGDGGGDVRFEGAAKERKRGQGEEEQKRRRTSSDGRREGKARERSQEKKREEKGERGGKTYSSSSTPMRASKKSSSGDLLVKTGAATIESG